MITIFIIFLLIQPKHAHVIQVATGKCPVSIGLRELMDRFLIRSNRAQFGQELREKISEWLLFTM